MLLHSEPCERNKAVIFDVLREVLSETLNVLEIGSGTGQHAVYFSGLLPQLRWQPSDVEDALESLRARVELEKNPNLLDPVVLDVGSQNWTPAKFDAIFTANTLHIVSWELVVSLFEGVGRVLGPDGLLIIYGPFKYDGEYTSSSNAKFDIWLKDRDSDSGVRDFEAVDKLAAGQGLTLVEDRVMPANNQCLVWKKQVKID